MNESNENINNECDKCCICLDIIINNKKKKNEYNKSNVDDNHVNNKEILDDINDNNHEILVCSHKFHKKCIDKWKIYNNKCPLCRASINKNRYNNNHCRYYYDSYRHMYIIYYIEI